MANYEVVSRREIPMHVITLTATGRKNSIPNLKGGQKSVGVWIDGRLRYGFGDCYESAEMDAIKL